MHITDITPTLQKKTEKVRLGAYCRVSSDSADQLHSFAAQIRYYSEYTKRHPEYELVDIYADRGLTGTDMSRREELHRLLRDCKAGKIDRILCKSVSRFARNTEEMLTTLRMLKEIGVSVFFEEQGIDTDKLNMEMIVTFPGMAAQQESEAISGNLRWAIQKKMESGEYVTPHAPYGYRLANKQLVIDPIEADVVKRIYALCLQGVGTQQIAELLNSEKIPRPKRKGYELWSKNTVLYILRNEKYIGDALLEKRYTTDSFPYRVKKNMGEKPQYYVENYCPAIIDKEVFHAVKELLSNKPCGARNEKSSPLSRMMRCPQCGSVFRKQIVNGKAYWLCAGLAANITKCQSRRIREDMVFDTFTAMAYKLKYYRQELIGTLVQRMEYLQDRTSENGERIRQIDKEIADLGAKNLVVTRLHTSGVIDTAEYTMQTSEISNKITKLRIERRKKLAEDEGSMFLDELRELDKTMESQVLNGSFNEQLFEHIVEKIVVEDSARLTFHLIGGLVLTEEIKEKGRCRTT